MSDLSRAAEAMGIPEPLAERSARARAEATGQSYEEILAAWAGGQAVAATAPAPEAETQEEAAPAPEPAEEAPAAAPAEPAAPATPTQPVAPAATVARGPVRPPILDAPPDRPLVTIAGGFAVIVLTVLLGIVFPSMPEDSDQIRSSEIAFSEAATEGRAVYMSAGCASCHTQAVRALVADVGVGPVTLTDTNQVVGYRRIGPDLSDVGNRLSGDQITAALVNSHPAMPLSEAALSSLASYLSESAHPAGGQS